MNTHAQARAHTHAQLLEPPGDRDVCHICHQEGADLEEVRKRKEGGRALTLHRDPSPASAQRWRPWWRPVSKCQWVCCTGRGWWWPYRQDLSPRWAYGMRGRSLKHQVQCWCQWGKRRESGRKMVRGRDCDEGHISQNASCSQQTVQCNNKLVQIHTHAQTCIQSGALTDTFTHTYTLASKVLTADGVFVPL